MDDVYSQIKDAIKHNKLISFEYNSIGEKNSHERYIVIPFVLGKKRTKKGERSYIRGYLLRGYSFSLDKQVDNLEYKEVKKFFFFKTYQHTLDKLRDYSERIKYWRIYRLDKMRNLKVFDYDKYKIKKFKASFWSEYNPGDKFFDSIEIARIKDNIQILRGMGIDILKESYNPIEGGDFYFDIEILNNYIE